VSQSKIVSTSWINLRRGLIQSLANRVCGDRRGDVIGNGRDNRGSRGAGCSVRCNQVHNSRGNSLCLRGSSGSS